MTDLEKLKQCFKGDQKYLQDYTEMILKLINENFNTKSLDIHHEIILENENLQINERPYRTSRDKIHAIDEQVNIMKKDGINRRSKSSFS